MHKITTEIKVSAIESSVRIIFHLPTDRASNRFESIFFFSGILDSSGSLHWVTVSCIHLINLSVYVRTNNHSSLEHLHWTCVHVLIRCSSPNRLIIWSRAHPLTNWRSQFYMFQRNGLLSSSYPVKSDRRLDRHFQRSIFPLAVSVFPVARALVVGVENMQYFLYAIVVYWYAQEPLNGSFLWSRSSTDCFQPSHINIKWLCALCYMYFWLHIKLRKCFCCCTMLVARVHTFDAVVLRA